MVHGFGIESVTPLQDLTKKESIFSMATWSKAELALREWLARAERRGCAVDSSTANRVLCLLQASGSECNDAAQLGQGKGIPAADPARLIAQVRAHLKQARERIKTNAPAYRLRRPDLEFMLQTQEGEDAPAITCDGHSIHKISYWEGKLPKTLLSSIGLLFRWHENNDACDKDGIFYGMHTLELYEHIADHLVPAVFPGFDWRKPGRPLSGRGPRARRIHETLTALLDPGVEWKHDDEEGAAKKKMKVAHAPAL